ncbi:MAG: hypothetical protein KJN64_13330 [Ignavibacteria bacterium]|nr:hypothetical protein [Ignavibacteria bacterium]MBT8383703.1 hypothetical protein [Ignavibacteria bacterium]NNJ52492.1 hypothetical protein [Ignavibacteriaceae bacterium]NNL21379.1 hypothetical protein [Ignavibacteriaceae bacterium]
MNRKNFFTKFSLAVLGLTLIKIRPVKFSRGKSVTDSSPVKIKVNKLAVKREKAGVKNV